MSWNDWVSVLESTPTDATYANEIDDYMQALAEAIGDRLAGFLYGFATGETAEAPGIINAIFKQQSAEPTTVNTDEIRLYAKDDGANCGLFAKNEDGYTKQVLKKIGTDLQFALEDADNAVLKSGVQTGIAGNKTFTENITVGGTLGVTGVATLAKASLLASTDAPTSDAMLANKKYVDDKDALKDGISPLAYAGEESVTLPNGLIMKMGYAAYAGNPQTITFGTAFPNNIISVIAQDKYSAVRTYSAMVTAANVTSFSLIIAEAVTGIYWQAIGY